MGSYENPKIKDGDMIDLEAVKSAYRRIMHCLEYESDDYLRGELSIVEDILEGRFTK